MLVILSDQRESKDLRLSFLSTSRGLRERTPSIQELRDRSFTSARLVAVSKNRAFEPIRRFFQWFWRIGGLDDPKSPLLLTPFGGWFLVLLCSPLLVSCLVIFIRSEVFLHRSISTNGTVIRMVTDTDEAVHYAPVFSFVARDGRAFTIESKNYETPPEFRVGQTVTVLYEKDHPELARIASYWQIHAFEVVSGSIGLFFSGIGLGSLIYQRRRARRSAASLVVH